MTTYLEKRLEAVKESDQRSYGKAEVQSMIEAAIARAPEVTSDTNPGEDSTCYHPIAVNEIRRGDVFIHKLIGGKVRPWIVLKVHEKHVTAIAMSTGEHMPGCVKSKCRFWPISWICPTVTNVTKDLAMEKVTRPYTCLRHLSEIEASLIEMLSVKSAVSMAEIRNRLERAA